MKTALLIDAHNLYTGITKKYPGKVLNYIGLLDSLKDNFGLNVFRKVIYGRQPEDKVKPFASMLRKNGFEVHFGNTPHNIEMALTASEIIYSANLECLILGTSYFEAGRILKFAKDRGVQAMSVGVGLPDFFQTLGSVWEVDETILTDRKQRNNNPESVIDLEAEPTANAA